MFNALNHYKIKKDYSTSNSEVWKPDFSTQTTDGAETRKHWPFLHEFGQCFLDYYLESATPSREATAHVICVAVSHGNDFSRIAKSSLLHPS